MLGTTATRRYQSPAQGRQLRRTPVQWIGPTLARERARLQLAAFDAPYLERLQRGDGVTERHFVDYFGELIRIKLRSRVSSREAIEDVRQETFMRVLALVRANQIREPERLGALVNSVCNHVLLEYYRTRRKVGASLDEVPPSSFISPEVAGAGLLEVREAERLVRNILGDLPERDRRLLQSVLLEERDKDEICAELGLTRDYLRVLLHRAKQLFKSNYLSRFGGAE
jgi:RNA polymerase sigma-70 factor, ECF subfamily